jgi:asparagine synthase (glutamine-hydrolysing)
MVADVKVNVALSGGIDSSLIYAYTHRHNPDVTGITIAFDDSAYDESKAAKAHADHVGGKQQVETTQVENKLDLLNTLLLHFDQPYADSSFIPFYFLSKAAAKHSKVLIGGDSGDEIHNGYMGFRVLPYLRFVQKYKLSIFVILLLQVGLPFLSQSKKRIARKFIGLLKTKNLGSLLFYWESWFPPDAKMYEENPFTYAMEEVLPPQPTESDLAYITKEYFVGRMQSDYLRKSDMMSMLNSLEFRVPMLDEDLTKFSLSIPYFYKSTRNTTKRILRKLHGKIYPEQLTQLPKKGFTIPLDHWLGEENLNVIKHKLTQPNTFYTKFIKKEYVTFLFNSLNSTKNEHFISRAGIYQRILIIYSLELWHDTYEKSNNYTV